MAPYSPKILKGKLKEALRLAFRARSSQENPKSLIKSQKPSLIQSFSLLAFPTHNPCLSSSCLSSPCLSTKKLLPPPKSLKGNLKEALRQAFRSRSSYENPKSLIKPLKYSRIQSFSLSASLPGLLP
jgi:hypothetical protein